MVKKIDSIEDERKGIVTYELDDGKRVSLSRSAVERFGLQTVLKHNGLTINTKRVTVLQNGRQIGTLPWDFDPLYIKSASPLYTPREGDFVRKDDGWHANVHLGYGDLGAIPGFVHQVLYEEPEKEVPDQCLKELYDAAGDVYNLRRLMQAHTVTVSLNFPDERVFNDAVNRLVRELPMSALRGIRKRPRFCSFTVNDVSFLLNVQEISS